MMLLLVMSIQREELELFALRGISTRLTHAASNLDVLYVWLVPSLG